jgi:L-2-hydroxyglutarate oxidase LhgO
MSGKKVFLDEEAGIILADSYMKCALNYLRGRVNVDLFEQSEVLDIKNDKDGVILEIKF